MRKRGEGGREGKTRRDARRDRGWAPQVEEEQSANDGGQGEKRTRELRERGEIYVDAAAHLYVEMAVARM